MHYIFLLLFYSSLFSSDISYFEDINNSCTSKSILKNTKFSPLEKDALNRGMTDSSYWLKLSIDNNSTQEIKKVISFKAPLMDSITLYTLKNKELTEATTVGHILKQNTNTALEPKLSLHITLLPDMQNIFYIKIKSQTPISLFFSIYSPKEFSNYTTLWYSSMAIYVGATLMILIYNLVLYFLIRIRSYLYYIIFHSLFLVFVLDVNGYLVQFVYPDNPIFERITIPLFLGLLLLAQLIFSYEFLDVKKHGQISKKIFKSLILIMLVTIPINFLLPFKEGVQIINLMALFVNLVPLVIAIMYWTKLNVNNAKYYIIAWTALIVGSIVEHLRVQGIIEINFSILSPMQIGVLIEMIIISIALANRFNTIKNENKALVSIVHTDFLTKIRNRNYFFEHANSLLLTLRYREEEYALIMLDIDYFKSINDKYGHSAGDKVLVKFSQEITKLLREEDVFARVGGEEFVLLIHANKEKAFQLSNRVRDAIESMSIPYRENIINCTVSLGIYSFNNARLTVDEILHKADQALYKAKDKGRNRIEFSS